MFWLQLASLALKVLRIINNYKTDLENKKKTQISTNPALATRGTTYPPPPYQSSCPQNGYPLSWAAVKYLYSGGTRVSLEFTVRHPLVYRVPSSFAMLPYPAHSPFVTSSMIQGTLQIPISKDLWRKCYANMNFYTNCFKKYVTLVLYCLTNM